MFHGCYISRTLALVLGAALISAGAWGQNNVFDRQIEAGAGIHSKADIDIPTASVNAAAALLYALEVRNASPGNEVKIGANGQLLKLSIQWINSSYYAGVIETGTNVPIRLNAINVPVEIIGGAHVTGGSTSITAPLDIRGGPIRVLSATTPDTGLHLPRSASDSTGLVIYTDPVTGKGVFYNSLTGAAGFKFIPGLSNLVNDITVYANHITMDSTDPMTLRQYIIDTARSIAWNELLDSASAQTVIEYVSSASDWIINHFDLIRNATGDLLPDFIEARITARLCSIQNLTIGGMITAASASIGAITANAVSINSILQVTGTMYWAPGTAFINQPTYDFSAEVLQVQIDANAALIVQLFADLAAFNAASLGSAAVIAITDTIQSGTTNYAFTLPDWDDAGTRYYGQRFRGGTPIVRISGADFAPYAILSPGAVAGATMVSHRGFSITLDEATTRAHEVRILAFLEIVTGIDLRNYAWDRAPGLRLPTTPITRQFGTMRR